VIITETLGNTLVQSFADGVDNVPGAGENLTGNGSEIEAQSDYSLLERM
jgi:hypothetical protein